MNKIPKINLTRDQSSVLLKTMTLMKNLEDDMKI